MLETEIDNELPSLTMSIRTKPNLQWMQQGHIGLLTARKASLSDYLITPKTTTPAPVTIGIVEEVVETAVIMTGVMVTGMIAGETVIIATIVTIEIGTEIGIGIETVVTETSTVARIMEANRLKSAVNIVTCPKWTV